MAADFSKIGKSNRSRGASYERKIAHKLTDAFNVKFMRSPRSGALLRQGAFNGVFIGGDLSSEKDFIFSIECKNCKDVNIESIIKIPNTAPIVKYWCQCVYDSNVCNKFPLMFFHLRSEDYVCVAKNGVNLLDNARMLIAPQISGSVKIDIDNKTVDMNDVPQMYIMLMKEFLSKINKDYLFNRITSTGKTINNLPQTQSMKLQHPPETSL